MSFYIPSLVQELYDGFTIDNIDRDRVVIEINWRCELRILHIQTISEIIAIPIVEGGNQNPRKLEEYMSIKGDQCRSSQGGGISAKTVYRNVYVVCRWLNQNVFGVSHISSFYNQALHIVHMMMTGDKHFCMRRQLLDTIIGVKFSSIACTYNSNLQTMDVRR